MKVAYLSGPADAPAIYRQWLGDEKQAYFGTDYMKQFLQLAVDLEAESYVITWHESRAKIVRHGAFTFDNRPLTTAPGVRYHVAQLWWHLRVAARITQFKPDLLILTGNQNFWWILSFTGAKLLPSFHTTLWPKFAKVKFSWKVLLQLTRLFVLKRCSVAVVTSHDIARQLKQLAHINIIHHLPTYSPLQFSNISPAVWNSPFVVIFTARIEINKGVYDLLEIARRLDAQSPGKFIFHICGSGSELERVRLAAPRNVVCHGFCNQVQMRDLMSQSHVSIVPTRTDFEAGFEMTCAEAILCDRPLITSAVCPALEYVRDAAIEVEANNIDSYLNAIVSLSKDRDLYECKRLACGPLKLQFFQEENSWITAMKKAIAQLHI